MPLTVELNFHPVGEEGLLQDAKNIRVSFQKALEKL